MNAPPVRSTRPQKRAQKSRTKFSACVLPSASALGSVSKFEVSLWWAI